MKGPTRLLVLLAILCSLGVAAPPADAALPGVVAIKTSAYSVKIDATLANGQKVQHTSPVLTADPTLATPTWIEIADEPTSIPIGDVARFYAERMDSRIYGTLNPDKGGKTYAHSTVYGTLISEWPEGPEPFQGTAFANCDAAYGELVVEADAAGLLETDSGEDLNGDGDFSDAGEHAPVVVAIDSPAPGMKYTGHLHVNGVRQDWEYTFNEQHPAVDGGSVLTYAGHIRLLGPGAVGDIWVGMAECGYVLGTTVPDEPSKPTATILGTSVRLAFTPGADGGQPITQFQARCAASGHPQRTATGQASPLTVTVLVPGEQYSCVVRAMNSVGWGPYGNSVSVIVPAVPGAPANARTTQLTPTSVRVSFSPGSDGGATPTYEVRCPSTNGGPTRFTFGPASPIVISDLSATHLYRCRVRASNSAGSSPYSPYTAYFAGSPVRPNAPGDLSIERHALRAVRVTFVPGWDGGSPVLYEAQCVSTSGAGSRVATRDRSPVPVTLLTVGATYQCRVRATNAVGTSAYSPYTNPFKMAPL